MDLQLELIPTTLIPACGPEDSLEKHFIMAGNGLQRFPQGQLILEPLGL